MKWASISCLSPSSSLSVYYVSVLLVCPSLYRSLFSRRVYLRYFAILLNCRNWCGVTRSTARIYVNGRGPRCSSIVSSAALSRSFAHGLVAHDRGSRYASEEREQSWWSEFCFCLRRHPVLCGTSMSNRVHNWSTNISSAEGNVLCNTFHAARLMSDICMCHIRVHLRIECHAELCLSCDVHIICADLPVHVYVQNVYKCGTSVHTLLCVHDNFEHDFLSWCCQLLGTRWTYGCTLVLLIMFPSDCFWCAARVWILSMWRCAVPLCVLFVLFCSY